MLGFGQRFLGMALGTPYLLWILSYMVYIVIISLTILNKNGLIKKLQGLNSWLSKHFIWDFSIRFMLQTCLDIYLICFLNFYMSTMPWERFKESQSFMETLDYFHLLTFLAVTLIMPIVVPLFLLINSD